MNEQDRQLLESFRSERKQFQTNRRKTKRRFETTSDFTKRKHRYTCLYCTKSFPASKLHTFVDPHHMVRPHETVASIAQWYLMTPKQLMDLNGWNSPDDLPKGFPVKVYDTHRIRKLTHGLCSCKACFGEKEELELDHTDYLHLVLSRRRQIRSELIHNPSIRHLVFERDQHQCVFCVKEYGKMDPGRSLTIDHKIPVSMGGTNDLDNLCCCCKEHNKDKGSQRFDAYMKVIKLRKR